MFKAYVVAPLRRRLGWLPTLLVRLLDPFGKLSYAQEGEDLLLGRILEKQSIGFYVDVGAHHPKRFSNTFLFYKKGWKGINVEPNPAVVEDFNAERSRDLNLCMGIASARGELTYFEFNDSALNTFDEQLAGQREKLEDYRIVRTKKIQVERLDSVLTEYLPKDTQIDFLTIDVEGFDLNVLESNDWIRFRPRYVMVEALEANLSAQSFHNEPVLIFMSDKGYGLMAKTYNSYLFFDIGLNTS